MREKAGAQRRLLSAREKEAGRADAPHPRTAPSCGGIRAVGDLADPQLWGGCGSGGVEVCLAAERRPRFLLATSCPKGVQGP